MDRSDPCKRIRSKVAQAPTIYDLINEIYVEAFYVDKPDFGSH